MAMVPVDTWALGCLILIWTWNILFVSFYGLSMKNGEGGRGRGRSVGKEQRSKQKERWRTGKGTWKWEKVIMYCNYFLST